MCRVLALVDLGLSLLVLERKSKRGECRLRRRWPTASHWGDDDVSNARSNMLRRSGLSEMIEAYSMENSCDVPRRMICSEDLLDTKWGCFGSSGRHARQAGSGLNCSLEQEAGDHGQEFAHDYPVRLEQWNMRGAGAACG